MGQQAYNYPVSLDPSKSIFSRELRMYQWRADPNFNSHIARVSFKSAFTQHQEDRFAQFLQVQEVKEYLQIYKFKEEIEQIPYAKDQQVVIFQKYHSTLTQLKGFLSFQETIYALYGLLVGYQQIKKVYEKVVVDAFCCFVTLQGSIRAWINPNPRINLMWKGEFGELSEESANNAIIITAIKIVEESGRYSNRGRLFFSQLFNIIDNTKFKNWTFIEIRQWINEYCYSNGIQMARRINLESNQKQSRYENPRETKKYLRHMRKTENGERIISNKENSLCLQTQERQNCSRSHVLKSKTGKKNIISIALPQKSENNQGAEFKTVRLSSNHQYIPYQNANQYTSQILQKKSLLTHTGKYSIMVQNTKRGVEGQNQIGNGKESTHVFSEGYKTSCIKNKIDEIPSLNSSSSQINNKKLIEKQIQVALTPSDFKKERKQSFYKKTAEKPKNSMKVSITRAIPQQAKQRACEARKTEGKNKHACISKEQIPFVSNSDIIFGTSRAWITTKTLTRLISENSDQSQVQNSISESSQFYNCSEYSGVLTQMGRDITQQNQENRGRSKTYRVSRQV